VGLIIKVNRKWIKAQIDAARESIGRDIIFYTVTRGACSLCTASGYYDTLNDTTYYFNCPICKGQYWIKTPVGTNILARVSWSNDQAITATPGGRYYLGDATATIEEKYLPIAEASFNESGRVLVDGRDMEIIKIIPEGAAEINRYKVVLKSYGSKQ
jgi:hypothetical protein